MERLRDWYECVVTCWESFSSQVRPCPPNTFGQVRQVCVERQELLKGHWDEGSWIRGLKQTTVFSRKVMGENQGLSSCTSAIDGRQSVESGVLRKRVASVLLNYWI